MSEFFWLEKVPDFRRNLKTELHFKWLKESIRQRNRFDISYIGIAMLEPFKMKLVLEKELGIELLKFYVLIIKSKG